MVRARIHHPKMFLASTENLAGNSGHPFGKEALESEVRRRMNAVEIEEAISLLAEQDFNAEEFPYAFLEAFGNKTTTIQRLKVAPPTSLTLAAFSRPTTSTSK